MTIIPQETPLKQCSKCREFFPSTPDFFNKDKYNPDGLTYACKGCRCKGGWEKVKQPVPEGFKRCSECQKLKPATLEYFHSNPTSKDGMRSACKECRKVQEARNAYLNPHKDRPEKYCPVCKQHKPIEAFARAKHRYDGRQARCRACAALRYAQTYPGAQSRLPEGDPVPEGYRRCKTCKKIFPATTDFFHKKLNGLVTDCRTCCSAHRRQPEQRAKDREYERWRYATRKEHINAVRRRRRAANKDLINAMQRAYYATHKDLLKQLQQKYKAADPLRYSNYNRVFAHKRRALMRGNGGKHTVQDIERQYKAQKGKCYYCGKKVGTNYQVDHVVPVTRGGSNDPSNLVIACPTCNNRKHNKLLHEWPEGNRLL